MNNCIFCKIASKEVPKEFTYEDDEVMVFQDINPVAPIHLLIVPRKHISDLMQVEDEGLMKKILKTAQKLVRDQKIEDKGYRLVINGGGAQIIDHLHVHLMGKIGKNVKV